MIQTPPPAPFLTLSVVSCVGVTVPFISHLWEWCFSSSSKRFYQYTFSLAPAVPTFLPTPGGQSPFLLLALCFLTSPARRRPTYSNSSRRYREVSSATIEAAIESKAAAAAEPKTATAEAVETAAAVTVFASFVMLHRSTKLYSTLLPSGTVLLELLWRLQVPMSSALTTSVERFYRVCFRD